MGHVLRIVWVTALLAVLASGCGRAAPSQRSALHGVPLVLAQDWEAQATAIAATGNSCRALQLAKSLRADVIAQRRKVPLRLRSPLVMGVKSLANRITCVPVTVPQKPKPTKPGHGHEEHGHHGKHGHGDQGGDGG